MNTYSLKPNEKQGPVDHLLIQGSDAGGLHPSENGPPGPRKILDNKYTIVKTIGEGRYAK